MDLVIQLPPTHLNDRSHSNDALIFTPQTYCACHSEVHAHFIHVQTTSRALVTRAVRPAIPAAWGKVIYQRSQ